MKEHPLETGSPRKIEAQRRFLAEFSLSCLEGVEPRSVLDGTAQALGRLLEVDRLVISFVEGRPSHRSLVRHASFMGPGIEPLPESLATFDLVPELPASLFSKSLVTSDVQAEPKLALLRERFLAAGTRSLISVPIRIDEKLRGIVVVSAIDEPRVWDGEDVAFLEAVVRQLAGALRQAELVAQVQQERDRLRVLFELVTAVHRSSSVSELIEAALEVLREKLNFPIGVFGLVTADGSALERGGGYGKGISEGMPNSPIPLGADPPSLAEMALASDEPIVVHDLETDPRVVSSRERMRQLGASAIAVFALRSGGKNLGVLMVGSDGETRKIEPDDVLTLQSLAGFVSIALEQRRTAEAAERSMREAHALSEASRALLTRTGNRDLLLNQLLDVLVLHFGQKNCRLLLVSPDRDFLVDWARRGDWEGVVGSPSLPLDGPGLTAAAARDGVVVNVADVRTDPRYLVGWPAARSELVVPLSIDDEVVGVFDIQSRRMGAFSASDVHMLSAFADRAALAIRLAELIGQLEARTRVLESVARAAKLLNFRLHTPDVLSSFVEQTSRAFPNADGCIAYVVKEDQASFSIAAAFGLGKVTQTAVGSDVIPIDEFRCAGKAFRENRPVFLEIQGLDELMDGTPSATRARARSSVANAEIRHLLAVPIRVGDRGLGVIEILALTPKAFTESDAETLVVLADHAAIALRNARMFEELQRSNRLKDDFLANLSHEVRTPLTGIVGWSEVLLDARGEDPETRRALEAILGQADTLSRMLADLIDLSRIDNFGLEIRRTRVKLTETIAAALDAVSPSAAKKGVELKCHISAGVPAIEGDPGRLKQVVWNLLTNGIKFSPAGSRIDIRLTRSHAGGVELTVSDQGSGIDPSFLPHVFERFRQEETSSNRRFGGLGVGLAIAQAIVGAHGGTIGVESEGKGRGCRFRVAFPATRLSDSSSGSMQRLHPQQAADAPPLPVVLVLESDPANRDHLVRLCESLGFQTTAAADEAEANEIGGRIRPGVFLIPSNSSSGPDGIMQALMRTRSGERIRFIAVTDSESDSEHRRLAGEGFAEVIVRPVRRTVLERVLAEPQEPS